MIVIFIGIMMTTFILIIIIIVIDIHNIIIIIFVRADQSWSELISADLSRSELVWADQSWSGLIWADQSWSELIWADLSWSDVVSFRGIGFLAIARWKFSKIDMHNQQTYVQNWIPRNWWSLIAETFIIFGIVFSSAIFRGIFFQQKMLKIEFRGIVGRQIIVIIAVLIRVVTIIVILIRVVTIIVIIIVIRIRVVIITQVVITLIITLVVVLVVIPSGKRYRISSGYHQRTTTQLFHQYGPPSGARRRVWRSYCMGSVSGMFFLRESVSRDIKFDSLEPSNH